jgi:hypothetical protein
MLHLETVAGETLSLIKELQSMPLLKSFYLVGGTSLALQIGHRTSTDIDLFNHNLFDNDALSSIIKRKFSPENMTINQIGIFSYIKSIKTDIVYHPCNIIEPPEMKEGILLAGLKDITAMKLNAITRRERKRDFIDIFRLLEFYDLEEMMKFFSQKYPEILDLFVLRSLVYFADAENDENPKCFFNYNWEKIKKTTIVRLK